MSSPEISVNPKDDQQLLEDLKKSVDVAQDRTAMEDIYHDNDLAARAEIPDLLAVEYSRLSSNIWRIHYEQCKRVSLGRIACRISGRSIAPLDYIKDPDLDPDKLTNLPAIPGLRGHLKRWYFNSSHIFITTPVLFKDMSADSEIAAKVGWQFGVESFMPDNMFSRDSLRPVSHSRSDSPVKVFRTAVDMASGLEARESWYSVRPNGDRTGVTILRDEPTAEEMTFRFANVGQRLPSEADRNSEAQLFALGLAQEANKILDRGY